MNASENDLSHRLLNLNRDLLNAIDSGDWTSYVNLCDEQLTAFEPEAAGNLVEGLDFHRFYFELAHSAGKRQSTISSPKVLILDDLALVTYIRLIQTVDSHDKPATLSFEETRLWQHKSDGWKNIHFHRSTCRTGG